MSCRWCMGTFSTATYTIGISIERTRLMAPHRVKTTSSPHCLSIINFIIFFVLPKPLAIFPLFCKFVASNGRGWKRCRLRRSFFPHNIRTVPVLPNMYFYRYRVAFKIPSYISYFTYKVIDNINHALLIRISIRMCEFDFSKLIIDRLKAYADGML